jgi:alkanesulfonate monooxygenase SsuD/methylene tetrahydromethanopterin reductase-like flavin-dependent oxidoreductase (luciferase family)
MEVDIILEPDLTPRQVAELGQAAEKFGVRALWTSNYFAHWDCLPVAGAAGRKDHSKLLMGPLAVSPFEMHPLKIANSLLSLNEMCGGRGVIAIGAGEGNIDAMRISEAAREDRACGARIDRDRAAPHAASSPAATRARTSASTCPAPTTWVKAQAAAGLWHGAYRGQMMRMFGARRRRRLHRLHAAGSHGRGNRACARRHGEAHAGHGHAAPQHVLGLAPEEGSRRGLSRVTPRTRLARPQARPPDPAGHV